MIKKTYKWTLIDINEYAVMRYCHNCGRKVIFKDSKKRRRNANGKTIYEYAIYKCERDHTWNLLINTFNAASRNDTAETVESTLEACSCDKLDLSVYQKEGINEIEIILEEVKGRWRVDRLLGDRIVNISRRRICELIYQGLILLDGKSVKQDSLLRKDQKITINLYGLIN